jgi:uncharacterized protein DUF2752
MNPAGEVIEALPAPSLPGNAIAISVLHLLALATAGLLPLDAPPLSLLACPFRAATGLPCLGCGCLHAFAAVAHLDLHAAVLANPLGSLLAIGGTGFAVVTALRLCGVHLAAPRIGPPRPRFARIAITVAVLANWCFVASQVAK